MCYRKFQFSIYMYHARWYAKEKKHTAVVAKTESKYFIRFVCANIFIFVFLVCNFFLFCWENEESDQPVKFIFVINCWRCDWVCCTLTTPMCCVCVKMTNATVRIMISIFKWASNRERHNKTSERLKLKIKAIWNCVCECVYEQQQRACKRRRSLLLLRIYFIYKRNITFLDWIFFWLGVMSVQHNNAVCCWQRECHNNRSVDKRKRKK